MVDRKRLELAVPTEPRDVSMDEDALLQNCFIDKSQASTMYAVKRPGFNVGTEGITTGLNRGIFFHDGVVWYIDSLDSLQGFIPPSFGSYSSSYYVVTENEDYV